VVGKKDEEKSQRALEKLAGFTEKGSSEEAKRWYQAHDIVSSPSPSRRPAPDEVAETAAFEERGQGRRGQQRDAPRKVFRDWERDYRQQQKRSHTPAWTPTSHQDAIAMEAARMRDKLQREAQAMQERVQQRHAERQRAAEDAGFFAWLFRDQGQGYDPGSVGGGCPCGDPNCNR
jgi:hypothetical protein